jgi:hypothetical protein
MAEYHYDHQSSSQQLVDLSRHTRIFILAGFLGGILGLARSIGSVLIFLAILPVGPIPISILNIIRRFAVILLIMGVIGLSIEYKASPLILVAVLDAVVLILNEIYIAYIVTTGTVEMLMALSLSSFIVGRTSSIIFGIILLRLRDRSSQSSVFTIYGLIEVMWPLVRFPVAIALPSVSDVIHHAAALVIGILSVMLYYNELRKGPVIIHDDAPDWSQSPEVWE